MIKDWWDVVVYLFLIGAAIGGVWWIIEKLPNYLY